MTTVAPGFMQPVFDAQSTFRSVLSALAEPGNVTPVICGTLPVLPDVSVAALATMLTLLDSDTSLWLPESANHDLRAYLTFHTGVRLVAQPIDADFAWGVLRHLPTLSAFHAGTMESPEHAATVLIDSVEFGRGPNVMLSGPGCDSPRMFAAADSDSLWSDAILQRESFPLGVDLLFFAESNVVGIPRSTRIVRAEPLGALPCT